MKHFETLGVVVGVGPKGASMLIQLQRHFRNQFIGIEASAVVNSWDSKYAGTSPTRTGLYYSDSIVPERDIPWDLKTFAKSHPMMNDEMLEKDILPKEVLQDYYRVSIESVNARILLGERVTSIQSTGEGFIIETGKFRIQAKYLIIATGPVNHKVFPEWIRKLPASCYQHSIGHGLFDSVKGKKILLVGGGHATPDIACRMWEQGASVTVVIRKSKFKLNYLPYLDKYIEPASWKRFRSLSPDAKTSVLREMAKEGPWVTPRSYEEFMKALRKSHNGDGQSNRIELLTSTTVRDCHVIDDQTDTKISVTFSNSHGDTFDKIICATGFRPDVRGLPFDNQHLWSAAVSDGLPHLNDDYSFTKNDNLYFMGHFAQLGPRGAVDAILHYSQYTVNAIIDSLKAKEVTSHVSNY